MAETETTGRKVNWGDGECRNCGVTFPKNSGAQIYCVDCAKMFMGRNRMRAAEKYSNQHYDRITIRVKKGYKDVIADHAKAMGTSMNVYICNAIDGRIIDDLTKKKEY
ncbi:hypothetical protein [Ruminococcus sp.]|uniref:hypothetical protein n=1 Tax=Ruminococcus sp. TaxID=41978 RepID=UPI001B77E4EB|nr:hypothetical protein [Ruminococcus sp.]MBP5433717.1 hypothetical protein [Ruminococcus sp.]